MSKSALVSRVLRSRAGAGILVAAPLAAAAVAGVATIPGSSADGTSAAPSTERQTFSSEGRTYTPPASSGGTAATGPQVESLPDVPASSGGFSGMVGDSTGSPSAPLPWLAPDEVPAYAGPAASSGDSSLVGARSGGLPSRSESAAPSHAAAPAPVATPSPQAPAVPPVAAPPVVPPVAPKPPVVVPPVAPKPPVVSLPPAPKPLDPPVTVPETPTVPDTSYLAPVAALADGSTCRVEGTKVYLTYILTLSGGRFVASSPFVSAAPGVWAAPQESSFDVPAGATDVPVTFPIVVVHDLAGLAHDVPGPASFDLPLSVCETGPVADFAPVEAPVADLVSDALDPSVDIPVQTDLDLIYQQLVEELSAQ